MATGPPASPVALPADVIRRLWQLADAGRWGLSEEEFGATLARSAAHRFREESPPDADVRQYLDSLRLRDLALASACARGYEQAWEHFVREFRPALLAAARSVAPPDAARDLADSLYADLFGLEERDGARRSLFDYFHGRSSLGGWLRAVLAQRGVDRVRAERRTTPLDEEQAGGSLAADAAVPDVDRARYLALVRRALAAALAALAPRDRLRLACYYTDEMTLAAAGRVLGESEATVSRKLERTRRDLRRAIERTLREHEHLSEDEVAACFDYGRSDAMFDLGRALPGTSVGSSGTRQAAPLPSPATCKVCPSDRSSGREAEGEPGPAR